MPLLEDEEGEPLNIGRRTRSIPTAIRRVLDARDQGCRFPGCSHTQHLHRHHIVHWSTGGETSLENLVSVCSHHHRLVHEGGFGVERHPGGHLVFTRPDGSRIDESSLPSPWVQLGQAKGLHRINEQRGIHIGPDTGRSLWDGSRMNQADAVDRLFQYRRVAS